MPNALLVSPENPITFWSFDEALKMVNKQLQDQAQEHAQQQEFLSIQIQEAIETMNNKDIQLQ